jgi:hypothetical protein
MIEEVSTCHVLTVGSGDLRELVIELKRYQLPARAFLVHQDMDTPLEIGDFDIRLTGSLKNGGEQKKRNPRVLHSEQSSVGANPNRVFNADYADYTDYSD